MRIAFLTPGYGHSAGVLGRHVQALASATAHAGAQVEVLLYAGHGDYLPADEEGISVRRFPSWIPAHDYALSGQLWSYLRHHGGDFDLVHAHGQRMLPALLLTEGEARHVIFTPHYYASAQPHLRNLVQGRRHRLDHRVLSGAERVLCISKSEALQVRRYAPNATVRIVPNGFDAASIAGAEPFRVKRRMILTVDRLTRWAGIHRVISALPALGPNYAVVVAGNGRGRGMLEAHADYLQVADQVRFLGAVSDEVLHRWLRTASVIATLKEESLWGGTLLTAACAGVPIIASDIPANREAIALTSRDGIEFVSRRASPFAIADAVRRLAAPGTASRADLVPSWENVGARTFSIYAELLRHEH